MVGLGLIDVRYVVDLSLIKSVNDLEIYMMIIYGNISLMEEEVY